MAAMELDPLFTKALKLLQSNAKDSGAQLKAMLDDAIAQRKGLKLPSQSTDSEKTGLSKVKSDSEFKRKEAEKRSHDKSVKDPFEPEVKRSKFDQLKQQKEKEAKEKERDKQKKEKEKKEKEEAQRQKDKAEKERKEKESAAAKQEVEIPSDEEEVNQQMDAGDFAIDLGIACVVCRQFDVSSGNQLVECQECRGLYHQECHKPAVTGQDVSDPRFVWYCSRCTKSFKKMVAQKLVKPSKPVVTSSSSTTKETTSTITKTSKPESDSGSQAFRRIDPKTIVSTKDTSSLIASSTKAMVGLAGLAANLTKPRGELKGSSVSKKSSDHHKGDNSKSSSSKSDVKSSSSSSSKQDGSSSLKPSSSSSSSSSKSDIRKTSSSSSSSSSSSGKEESSRDGGKKSESKSYKSDDKKSDRDGSSSRKEEKKEKSDSSGKSSKEDKKSDKYDKPGKPSPSHSNSSNSNSPPSTPISPGGSNVDSMSGKGSGNGSGTGSSNKQAVANLSMVTANKRIQMMKKKAQAATKPQEKRVHIK